GSGVTRDGQTVGALAVVNACGSVNVGRGPHFWAAPFEVGGEFGGLGFPREVPPDALIPISKGRPGENTTIAIVATDAALSKAQAKELAVIAQDGFTRAIYPAHTTLAGDAVFAAATGRRPLADAINELTEIGTIAANTLARAVARGVFEAKARPGGPPSWRDRFAKWAFSQEMGPQIYRGLFTSASNWPVKLELRGWAETRSHRIYWA